MKLAVYTCVTANYDPIRPPVRSDPDVRYICFTDYPGELPSPWVRGTLPRDDLNAKDLNRYVKMFPHRLEALDGCDVSVYMDGSIRLVGDIREFVETTTQGMDRGVWMFDHPHRDCVYEEGYACAHYAHDWVWTIAKQLSKYRKAGLPRDWGLFEANVIVRFRQDNSMHRLMQEWWDEYLSGSGRDQIALPQAQWHTGINIKSMGRSDARTDHRFFEFIPHRRRILFSANAMKIVNRTAIRLFGTTLFPATKLDV